MQKIVAKRMASRQLPGLTLSRIATAVQLALITGLTVGAREHFETWRNHMLRLTELFNERLAADEVHVVENLRLRLGSGKRIFRYTRQLRFIGDKFGPAHGRIQHIVAIG